MGLGYLVLGLGLACGEGSEDVGVSNNSSVVGVASEAEVYQVVSEDDLRSSYGASLLELQISDREGIFGGSSWRGSYDFQSGTDGGYGSLFRADTPRELAEGLREEVLDGNESLSGLVLHTYNLNDQQTEEVVEALGIPNVAYVEEMPQIQSLTWLEPNLDGTRTAVVSTGSFVFTQTIGYK